MPLYTRASSPVDYDGEEIAGMMFVLGWRRHVVDVALMYEVMVYM